MADQDVFVACLDFLEPKEEPGKRRATLLQAAFEVIAEVGFEGLRTRTVADRVGVNVATLHYYFPSKQSLIEGLAQFISAKFVVIHGPQPEPTGYPALDRLRQEFSDGRHYLRHHPEMLLVMQEFILRGKRDPEVQKIVERMTGWWRLGIEQMVDQGVSDGTFRTDLDREEQVATLMAVFGGVAAAGIQHIDAIERSVETWLLARAVIKRMERKHR
jgi:TetR/AcrR family transcriptional regulator, regulator of cefoperazone and chloramphenicol sensitivity